MGMKILISSFSHLVQGRSRTMNETTFSIYKSNIPAGMIAESSGPGDIKKQPLTTLLYTKNCDCKMAGNLSSIYQTLVALFNLSQDSFYYSGQLLFVPFFHQIPMQCSSFNYLPCFIYLLDEIVNSFIEKLEMTIKIKVKILEDKMARGVLGTPVPARILQHIFLDKFHRSSNKTVAENELSPQMVDSLVRQIVQQKFEQRHSSGDIYDNYIRFLSGEQESLMEISYTKQQQKQKQKQKTKSQDNDTMDAFDKRNQLSFVSRVDNYFDSTINAGNDNTKINLSLPIPVPIFTMQYSVGGRKSAINVYPTIQFLYSHHIVGKYITDEVHHVLKGVADSTKFCSDFVSSVLSRAASVTIADNIDPGKFHSEVNISYIKQNPQYSLVGIQPGVYIIGMKDQFNVHDRETHPLRDMLQYAADEIGFVLFDKTNSKSVDDFGPYFIEQYLLLDSLSKQEVAQNVITYYCKHKEKLQQCLEHYDEKQGKGFICWRFLINQSAISQK